MAGGDPKFPMTFRMGGDTFAVVPARDVLDIRDRQAARRLLDRVIDGRADISKLRKLVEEIDFGAIAMSSADVLARAEALLANGRMVGVRLRGEHAPLDRPEVRPLVEPRDPEPARARRGPDPVAPSRPSEPPAAPSGPSEPPAAPSAPAPAPTFVGVRVVDQYGEPLEGTCRLTADGRDVEVPLSQGVARLDPVSAGGRASVSLRSLRRPSGAVPGAIHPEASDHPVQRFPYRDALELPVEHGRIDTVVVECPHIVRVETSNLVFANTSAIPVPLEVDGSPLRALATAILYLHDNPARSLLVVGHASAPGPAASNEALAQHRADAMLALARRDRDAWVALATAHGAPADVQMFLRYFAQSRGWATDPGRTDGTVDAGYHDAAERFQARYNLEFGASLLEDGVVGTETLGAIFEVQLAELDHMLVTLDLPREPARSFSPGAIAAGERLAHHPKLPDSATPETQRRVDLLLVPAGLHWQKDHEIVSLVDSATFEILPIAPHVPGPRDLVFRLVDHYGRPMPDEPYRLRTDVEQRQGRADATGTIVERSLTGRWAQLEVAGARAIAIDVDYIETSRMRHDLPSQVEAVAAQIAPDDPFIEDDSEHDLDHDWLDQLFEEDEGQ